MVLDLILCGVLYAMLLAIIFVRENRKRNRRDSDRDDDEGGLPVSLPPDFDLPPGVCWPDDAPKVKKEPEEALA